MRKTEIKKSEIKILRSQIREELGPYLTTPSQLYHLHQWIIKCKYKKWRGCSSHYRRSSCSTYCCVNHQNQGSIIHHFLQRRTCCLVSALLGISTNGNSAHHLHQPSIAMRDNISMQARYQLYLAKHILHFIIQRVPRHSSIPDNKLSDRHHLTPSTLHFYHVLFGLSTKCSMGNHLITPKEIKLTITARSWPTWNRQKAAGMVYWSLNFPLITTYL